MKKSADGKRFFSHRWSTRAAVASVLAGGCLAITLASTGCSKSEDPSAIAASTSGPSSFLADPSRRIDPMGTDSAPSSVMTPTNPTSATDVVTEFLDLVRRGDADDDSDRLLTTRARRELARIGHRLQPLGSPSARFEVTRAENVPDSPGSALVHSYWSEPTSETEMTATESSSGSASLGPASSGQATTAAGSIAASTPPFGPPLQVVWAVQWERSAWRISGLAVQMQPGGEPLVLDFENGDAMASYLDDTDVAARTAESTNR